MTQTANLVTLLASSLGEEDHEVAKGWTVVILIMILDVDVTAEGGIIKLIARKGNPQPSEPSEPSEPPEPSEPGPRSSPLSVKFYSVGDFSRNNKRGKPPLEWKCYNFRGKE